MLEAEWRQVLWGSMSTGTKEGESITGHFETYEPFISLIFKFFGVLR
jgi:hypothetical protein